MQDNHRDAEFVTIIASTQEQAAAAFKLQGLDQAGFAIVGPIGRHRISFVDGVGHLDRVGEDMFAATFRRIRNSAQTQQ